MSDGPSLDRGGVDAAHRFTRTLHRDPLVGRRSRGARAVARLVTTIIGLATLATLPGRAVAAPTLPPPSYDNTFYAFVYDAPLWSETDYVTSRDTLLGWADPGSYARIGFTTYYPIDLPWTADLSAPVLTSPSRDVLETILARLDEDGLVYHVSTMLGMSRFFWLYDEAKRDDRRNAQWFSDNLALPPGRKEKFIPGEAWVTPSRYARKLRRHMEAKCRAFARMFAELRATYPHTLISASGDAEAELDEARADHTKPLDAQIIADYSPFAVLEFRDWLLRTGLYAQDGPYAGQGYKRKKKKEDFEQGPGALTPANLARFNATFGTSFTTWNLRYYHWSLDDPIDDDPRAIKFKKYKKKKKFEPMPTKGAQYIPGGFDAPRSTKVPSKKFWKLWRKFRERMITNFARDVATWMTTPDPLTASRIEPDRWYTHQIPANYLNGTYPGAPNPPVRLRTSASPLASAFIPPELGSAGVTILDRYELNGFGPPGGYNRTSAYALDAIEALNVPNWGIPEYAPSWHIDVAPDPNVARITAQWHRVHGAGAHMVAFTPWPHFTGGNAQALGEFLAQAGDAPRASNYGIARSEFVQRLYADLLGRAPSGAELATRMAAIADGSTPRPKLVVELIASVESKETVAALVRLYVGLLGRLPTIAEYQAGASFLSTAPCNQSCRLQRRRQIVDQMFTTPAFQARFGGANPSTTVYVNALFAQILGRAPSADELNLWVSTIDMNLVTRREAARMFVEGAPNVAATENDTTVVLLYAGLLGRMPTPAERAEWTGHLANGLSRRGAAQTFLISPEYRQRVAS